ncbi:MAG: response regulator transcription factor [Thiohalocapsa sp.]|jgi:DNA-binding NarL/FixJ family response regulator|uniref:response regulator transcription factor n=1 Tax=Thiohalocapsa sp. TaxID=2497641 RepID=UPI0025CE946F|nr:response regulator transcription factor [Thiohalocapsa sp.]MCG6941344.1 response regulator transcription factor [Thiohalocapsa sp.]
MTITVVLADDHKMIRESLGALLSRETDIRVVAFASDGSEAITLAQAWKPDIVLMDVCMPGVDGIEAAQRIVKLLPRTRVIALSAQGERPFVSQMVEAGVQGYVLKDESVATLAHAIRTVARGQSWLPEAGEILSGPEKRLLSRRERLVLKGLAEGKRAREVAEVMGISTKTVDTYRRRMMSKLGLESQAELVKYAVALHTGVGTGMRGIHTGP